MLFLMSTFSYFDVLGLAQLFLSTAGSYLKCYFLVGQSMSKTSVNLKYKDKEL